MVDGAASLMTAFYGMAASSFWNDERGTNLLDTGAHFYNVYETADGGSHHSRPDRAPVLRGAAGAARPRRSRVGPAARSDSVARPQGEARRGGGAAHARRVVRAAGRHRHMFRPGALGEGGAPPPPQSRARHFHRGSGSPAAQSGTALQPHAPERSAARRPSPASTPTRSSPNWASTPTRSRRCASPGRSLDSGRVVPGVPSWVRPPASFRKRMSLDRGRVVPGVPSWVRPPASFRKRMSLHRG